MSENIKQRLRKYNMQTNERNLQFILVSYTLDLNSATEMSQIYE